MKLHYMGKFNLDPDSLPQAEHKPGAVEFKEADSMKKLSVIANTVACIILVILGAAAFFRIVPVAEPKSATITWFAALLGSIVIIFPHELLHALCMLDEAELIEFAEERPALLIVTPGGATASLRRPQKGERLSLAGPTPMK